MAAPRVVPSMVSVAADVTVNVPFWPGWYHTTAGFGVAVVVASVAARTWVAALLSLAVMPASRPRT